MPLLVALAGCDAGESDTATDAHLGHDAQLADGAVPQDGGLLDDGAVADADAAVDGAHPDSAMADAGGPMLPPPERIGPDERSVVVLTPPDYDAQEPLPLVVLLGGYANLASDLDGWLGTSEYLSDYNFILALPDGLIDSEQSPYWHATDTCCDFDGRGNDDVAFLTDVIDDAQSKLAVDSRRVILLGHSNGGFMGYRMACDRSDRVTAVLSIAGSGWLDAGRCAPDRPVSVLQVHGELDEVMPIGGDDSAPGALEMLGRWAQRNGCDADSWTQTQTLELIADDRDAETTEFEYRGCAQGVDTRFWRVAGSDHYPEFDWSFTEAALEWALAHPRQ